MGKQLLFCVEADRQSKTDWVYIHDTIDWFYKITNDISIKPIFMGGKTNYRRDKVKRQIREHINAYRKNGRTFVIYCIDTDELSADPDRAREFSEIQKYCEKNECGFIWFCRNIEEVFWGKEVERSEKLEYAKRFRNNSKISEVKESNLNRQQQVNCTSNILDILNQILERK